MTREEAISILHGIRADNLNFDDLYTKDKYNALSMAIKALEQEPCDDAISRQEVDEVKELMTDMNGDMVYVVRMSDIRQLPPVNPQPKTGHWIETDTYEPYWYRCSECCRGSDDITDYCPNCGARMQEVGE